MNLLKAAILLLFGAMTLVQTPLAGAAASSSGGGLVCTPPTPHTTQCYSGSGSLGRRNWRGTADCCEACQNITAPVSCAVWVHKSDKCILLPASARPRSGTNCTSGSSLPAPSPSPSPAAHDPLNPKLPPNRWGPFVGRKAELAPEYSFVSGL